MMVAQTPQTESPASWPVSEQAGGQVSKRAGTLTARSLCFPLGFGSICYSLLLRRERSRQVSLVSTTLSARPVGKGSRDKRAERECDAGLRARAGSGREALLAGESGEDRFPVQSGLRVF